MILVLYNTSFIYTPTPHPFYAKACSSPQVAHDNSGVRRFASSR